ncbi:MAG: RNA polymerase sigma-70 factor [Niabella sp.]|nr:RNA polymerase sigma-70 factor [Niabella sp.]
MPFYQSSTDEDLLSLLKLNDKTAFTEIYDRYWKRLLVRAKLLLNVEEDAEEVVNDIFVTLWRKRATLQINKKLSTYIGAMLQYACFKVLAESRRRRITVASLPESADYGTLQWLDFESLSRELEAAVSNLPERCQLIFRLSREAGLNDKEIARQLGLSVNTVRTQMHRALSKLKDALGSFFML